jgi:hypothetical protein
VTQAASDEEESLPPVRSADARSAGIECPAGVSLSFQVRANNVEPREPVLARNLLAKDDVRSMVADEGGEHRPEVALVVEASSFACVTERLARARARPDGAVVGPSSEPKSVGPGSDACEEVDLRVPIEFLRLDLFNASTVHDAWSDVPRVD